MSEHWSSCPKAALPWPENTYSRCNCPAGEPTPASLAEVDEPTFLDKLRAALVDSAGLDSIPDPDPLIGEDILFRDCINWMVGKPGCMKSFTALDMAGCVGTGQWWQGHRVEQGAVLYLVAEGVRGTKKRVRAWEQAMGRRMDAVWFLPVAVQTKNAGQWDALVTLAEEIGPVLIVLDTQARITVGVEENSNTEMGMFVDQAERLRRASGACVLIVHHMGRLGEHGRGGSNVDGAMSTIIKVSKDGDRVKLECAKNKDGAEWDPIELRAVPMGDSVVLMLHDGAVGASGGLAAGAVKMARAWWECHGGDWVSLSTLVDSEVTSKPTFHRHRPELERAGVVEKDPEGRYPRYRMVKAPETPASLAEVSSDPRHRLTVSTLKGCETVRQCLTDSRESHETVETVGSGASEAPGSGSSDTGDGFPMNNAERYRNHIHARPVNLFDVKAGAA